MVKMLINLSLWILVICLLNERVTAQIVPCGFEAPADAPIEITFSKSVEESITSTLSVTSGGAIDFPSGADFSKIDGEWKKVSDKIYRFTPARKWNPGELITVSSPDDLPLPQSDASGKKGQATSKKENQDFSFIVDDGVNYGFTNIDISSIKKTDEGKHNIPMKLCLPLSKGPHPVFFWVHGGSFRGGTPEESNAQQYPQADYLAKHLGIASVGVAYRCTGSNGTFTKGIEDISDALKYVKEHAKDYDLDPTRFATGGGSAGTPLSSLVAQRFPEVICYVGINGFYNLKTMGMGMIGGVGIGTLPPGEIPFTQAGDNNNDNGEEKGGGGGGKAGVKRKISSGVGILGYGLSNPSAEANSAYFNLRRPPPATILLHGTDDTTVNPKQSVEFGKKITEEGGVARVLMYSGEKHGFTKNEPARTPTLYEIKEFLKKYLIEGKAITTIPASSS
jgi:acetyl esterase/lipase